MYETTHMVTGTGPETHTVAILDFMMSRINTRYLHGARPDTCGSHFKLYDMARITSDIFIYLEPHAWYV
jgi:hypothetical protein